MTTPFTAVVHQVADGDPVDAAHANQPTQDLTQRTDALKEIVDTLESGSLLRVENATLQPGMTLGTPVYLDQATSTYRPAISALSEDAAGGLAAPSAYVFGVLVAKTTDTLGAIGVLGRVSSLTSTQWALVMEGGVFAAGHYFLSDIDAGKIGLARGSLSIYVGQALPDGSFLVRAAPPVEGAHAHYTFALLGKPAGTVVDPALGATQLVNTPDATQRGWLPATNTYFNPVTIPVGAKFGYNFAPAAEANLASVFPPIPLSGAFFAQGGAVLDSSKITVNDFGIWWMDDSYGKAPWPVDYAATTTAGDIAAWFSRLLAATAGGLVSRLQSHPSSVLNLQIVDPAGNPATSGKLLLLVTQLLAETAANDEGALALKSVTGGGFTRGPVISRVRAGSGLQVSGSQGDAVAGWYGVLTLASANSDSLQGDADIVDLANAREDSILDVQMVTLPSGRAVKPVFSLHVSRLAPASSKMRPKLWLYSSISGAVPAGVVIEYRIVPSPGTNSPLPTGWTALTSITGRAMIANQSAEFALAPDILNVPAGAVVLIRVTRAGDTDGFVGNLGIIRLGFQLL